MRVQTKPAYALLSVIETELAVPNGAEQKVQVRPAKALGANKLKKQKVKIEKNKLTDLCFMTRP